MSSPSAGQHQVLQSWNRALGVHGSGKTRRDLSNGRGSARNASPEERRGFGT